MARSKADAFLAPERRLAASAKALAHPARVAILKVLAERGTCICNDVVEELPLAQATVSQHLKALREAGLIRGEADGPRVCYCIDREGLRRFIGSMKFLTTLLDAAPNDDHPQPNRCC